MHTDMTRSDSPPPGVPQTRGAAGKPGEQVHFTRDIPRGSTALDRYGKRFAVWPDGSHGYSRKARTGSGYSSFNFGPYTIERVGLSKAECDEAVADG